MPSPRVRSARPHCRIHVACLLLAASGASAGNAILNPWVTSGATAYGQSLPTTWSLEAFHADPAFTGLTHKAFCKKLWDTYYDGRRKNWGDFQKGLTLWSHTSQKPLVNAGLIEYDPVVLLNVHGSGYCEIQSGMLEGLFQSRPGGSPGLPAIDARRWSLNGTFHSVADAYYEGRWHYFDIDLGGYAGDAARDAWSMADVLADKAGYYGTGTTFKSSYFFSADGNGSWVNQLDPAQAYCFQDCQMLGHTMGFALRAGETFTRYFSTNDAGWTEFAAPTVNTGGIAKGVCELVYAPADAAQVAADALSTSSNTTILAVRCPYNITSSRVTGTGTLRYSYDLGATWKALSPSGAVPDVTNRWDYLLSVQGGSVSQIVTRGILHPGALPRIGAGPTTMTLACPTNLEFLTWVPDWSSASALASNTTITGLTYATQAQVSFSGGMVSGAGSATIPVRAPPGCRIVRLAACAIAGIGNPPDANKWIELWLGPAGATTLAGRTTDCASWGTNAATRVNHWQSNVNGAADFAPTTNAEVKVVCRGWGACRGVRIYVGFVRDSAPATSGLLTVTHGYDGKTFAYPVAAADLASGAVTYTVPEGASTNQFIRMALTVAPAAATNAAAGNWIGYEGALHQSSSPTDLASPLTRLWDQRFTNKVTIPAAVGWSGTNGNHSARNLTYFGGYLGLVASVANQTKTSANVAILDATNGAVVNCVATDRELDGAYKTMWDATETAWGEHVAAWDPDTGILFLAIGGDRPSRTAILPLANRATYSGSVQTAIGAYATLATNFPDLRGGNDQRRDSAIAGNVRNGGALANDEWGEAQNLSVNRTAMFDVQAGSSWLVINRDLGHSSAAGSSLANKFTGLPAKKPYGDMSNPLDYDSTVTESGFPCFKYWGGILTATNRVYFLGPYESGLSPYDSKMKNSSRGLRVACMVMSNADVRVNGGYTGLGAAETAMPVSEVFDVGFDSTTTNINESWRQNGAFNEGWQRNKAWLVQGDGIWAAWKPSFTSAVELVRVTGTESNRYSLGVGTNMLYQDIWPNIAYTDCGAAGRYVVYYLANAFTGPADLGSTTDGVTNEWAPAGPASLTVFDASARTVRWTFELNNAARTGAYPDLPPNPAGCWYESSRLVVAGRYAHIAWVEREGAGNAQLKVTTFDVAGSAPAVAPAALAFDLGIPKTGNSKSRVTDLIAVTNMLYALVTEDDAIDRAGEINAQRIVALQGAATGATNPVYWVTNTVVVTGTNAVGATETTVQDTYMLASQPDNDGFRNSTEFRASSISNALAVALLRFALPALTNNEEIVSASLRLYCTNTFGTPVVAAYPVLKAWSGRYACFNYRDNGIWWNSGNLPFDLAPPTEDYDAGAGVTSATFTAGTHVTWDVTPMVANWYANPSANYGLALLATAPNSECRFRSSNFGDTNFAPALVLTTRYASTTPTPSDPPEVWLTGLTVGSVSSQVVWTNIGGPASAYRVYRSTNLLSTSPTGGWVLMGDVGGANAWVDTNRSVAGEAVFYRILAP